MYKDLFVKFFGALVTFLFTLLTVLVVNSVQSKNSVEVITEEKSSANAITFVLASNYHKFRQFGVNIDFKQPIKSHKVIFESKAEDISDSCQVESGLIRFLCRRKAMFLRGENLRFIIEFANPVKIPPNGFILDFYGDTNIEIPQIALFDSFSFYKRTFQGSPPIAICIFISIFIYAGVLLAFNKRYERTFFLIKSYCKLIDNKSKTRVVDFFMTETILKDRTPISWAAEITLDKLIDKKGFIKQYIAPIPRNGEKKLMGKIFKYSADEALYIRIRNQIIMELLHNTWKLAQINTISLLREKMIHLIRRNHNSE